MATSGEGLSFGDFGDLPPDENERIYCILHQKKNAMVEFPWDGKHEAQTDDGGNHYFLDKTGFSERSGVQRNEGPIYQEAEFTFGTVQMSELSYGSGVRHIISFDDTNECQEIGKQSEEDEGLSQAELAERNSQSKLQASLKQYERRNKKKRPPDYYNERTDDHSHPPMNYIGYSGIPGQPVYQQMMSPQNRVNVYNSSPINNHSMDYTGGSEVYNRDMVSLRNEAQYLSYRTEGLNTHTNQALTYTATMPYAGANQLGNNIDSQQQGELQEVIVDSNSMAYTMPARTETYQVQDHIRTSTYQNVQFGGDFNSVSVGKIIPVHDERETNSVNLISNVAPADNENISKGIAGTASPSQHRRDVVSQHQSDAGLNVNQVIPNTYIPTTTSQNGQQSVTVEQTAGGEPGNMKKDVSESVVSDNEVSLDVKGIVESDSPNSVNSSNVSHNSVPQDPKPKLTWAGLFKGSTTGSVVPQVISDKTDNSVSKPDNSEVTKKQEKEFSPVPVPAKDDSIAEELGELLSQLNISHTSVALQPRGLVNRGNWCYINGTLQALVACPPFYNLLKKMPRYPALSRGPSSTPILDSLVEFVHEFQPLPRQVERGPRNRNLREISPGPPFEPSYVYKMLQAIAVGPHFKLGKQEDAEEFLSCILDGTHEEMAAAVNLMNKQPVTSPTTEASEEEGFTNGYYHADEEEDIPDEENWEQVGPKQKSVLTRRSSFAKTPIADIFAGMIRSGVYKASAKETATLEPFFTLQLDIQSEKVCSVRDAMEGLVSKEVISGYTDPKTNTEVEVVKKLSLEELPPVLILHLKFFVYNKDGGSQKLMKKVDYPVELEITKDLLSPSARNKLNIQQRSYKLFAVVYHHGKHMNGGHYTTCVFHPGINGWVLSDDSTVCTVPVGFVLKYNPPRIPYLLYYRRLDSH